MVTVRRLPGVGLVAVVAVLAALGAAVGLTTQGWWVGLACGVVVNAAVPVGLHRTGSSAPGPADLVTLGRAVLTCAVAALTADALLHQRVTALFVPLTVAALVLDAVDGWVARYTLSSSAFGGRFDGEADAFLILVLSVYVAPVFGAWVLCAGLVRYVFAVAGWVAPWMRAPLPFRYWRKVVTATLGVVLTVAAADLPPRWVTVSALLVGLGLLAESFGRDVVWLWNHRVAVEVEREPGAARTGLASRPRRERV